MTSNANAREADPSAEPSSLPGAPSHEPRPEQPPQNGLSAPAARAMATLALLVAVPYAIPGLARLRLLAPLPDGQGLAALVPAAPVASVGETALVIETTEQAELQQP